MFEQQLSDRDGAAAATAVRASGVRLQLHDSHAVRVGRTEKSPVGHRRPVPTVDQHSDGRQGGQLGRAQGRIDAPVRDLTSIFLKNFNSPNARYNNI